jgi:hypothetical protein
MFAMSIRTERIKYTCYEKKIEELEEKNASLLKERNHAEAYLALALYNNEQLLQWLKDTFPHPTD